MEEETFECLAALHEEFDVIDDWEVDLEHRVEFVLSEREALAAE